MPDASEEIKSSRIGRARAWTRSHRAFTALALGLPIAALITLALLTPETEKVFQAMAKLEWQMIAAALALSAVAAAFRLEAWRVCLAAVRDASDDPSSHRLSRREIYTAGSIAVPVAVLNAQLSAATRLAALRKIAPERAPSITQLIAAEIPVYGAELIVGAALLSLVAPALGLPIWIAPMIFAALLLGGRSLAHRAARSNRSGRLADVYSGVSVLSSAKGSRKMIALVAAMNVTQVARIWLLLSAVGLGVSPWEAAAVLVGQGLFSQLPIGPAGASSASIAVLGSQGLSAATAAGLAVTATELTAGIGLCLFASILAAITILRSRRQSSQLERAEPLKRALIS